MVEIVYSKKPMENRFEFYKEFYFKELDKRNEINNSLSLPIGIITTLVAGLLYLITNFDYYFHIVLSVLFIGSILVASTFLIISIYHLVKSYSDFPKGYDYVILPDTNQIDKYEKELKKYYADNKQVDISKEEAREYVLSEMIKNTGENQKNNKRKGKFRYKCENNLIYSLILICLTLVFFGVNYALKDEKTKISETKVINSESIKINLDTKENRNFILEVLKDSIMNKKNAR
jgi:hypothetical protein